MSQNELIRAIAPVVGLFEQLEVKYYIAGSVASSALGVPRTTLDADIVANLNGSHVTPMCDILEGEYYISRPMIQSAIDRQSSFNLIHLKTMFKIDVFACKRRDFDQTALMRIRPGTIGPDDDELPVFLASPEDIVLAKLEWYRLGDELSQRQWTDVVGVLTVQESAIDRQYLRHWARRLGVVDLLDRAMAHAGLA